MDLIKKCLKDREEYENFVLMYDTVINNNIYYNMSEQTFDIKHSQLTIPRKAGKNKLYDIYRR